MDGEAKGKKTAPEVLIIEDEAEQHQAQDMKKQLRFEDEARPK